MRAAFCSLLLLLGPAIASAESPTEDDAVQKRIEGQAQNAKGGAMLMAASGAHYVRGMGSWPDGVRGQSVWMTGTVSQEVYIPEAVQAKDGSWSQGVAPGSGGDLVITPTSWELVDLEGGLWAPPWRLEHSDGSGNLTVISWTDKGEQPTWRYDPVTPAMSSSGHYDGGPPATGTMGRDRAAALCLAAAALQTATAEHIDSRMKGTTALTIHRPSGQHVILAGGGDHANAMRTLVSALREKP